jgi:hypothetical protein
MLEKPEIVGAHSTDKLDNVPLNGFVLCPAHTRATFHIT